MHKHEQVTEHKSFAKPEEVRTFPNGRAEILKIGGAEFIAGPGDITSLPKWHDTWVVGGEPVVVVDWYGASNYARRP
jgi:hypothetical protein